MAENTNLKYEQINWGWLNDYSGYKFAPITFFDNLYTEDGKSFKDEYNTTLEKLRNGEFLVGRAQALAIPNADGSSTLFETSSVKPVYFHEGKPTICERIEINVTGNLTGNVTGNLTGNVTGDLTGNVNSLDDTQYNIYGQDMLCTRVFVVGSNLVEFGFSATPTQAIAKKLLIDTDIVMSSRSCTIDAEENILNLEAGSVTLVIDGANKKIMPRTSSGDGKASGAKIYGAVWNDYAEFRDQYENIEPGYCVCSSDSGKVFKTMEKLAPCDGIVSDTFGFAIGEDDICQTPLAVAGRVLAYCEGDRADYHAGDTVCASANGKVCKMTREEIREYPDRIVGVVSEIPQYEIWNNGIEVKGRIWVNVK